MRFAEIVADLEVDDVKFARQMGRLFPAEKSFLIVFTPRSGSSWLADLLTGTDRLGKPREYLNENFIRKTAQAMHTRDQTGLLQMLLRRRKTANNVFSIKVTIPHILSLGEAEFFEVFGRGTPSFQLWRRNIVAQSISMYRAAETGHFHSDEDACNGAAAPGPPTYNASRLKHYIAHLLEIENKGHAMLRHYGHAVHPICYEDIVKSEENTLGLFCRTLGLERASMPAVVPLKRKLTKIADTWSEKAEEVFRATEAVFLGDIEARRLMTTTEARRPATPAGR